MNTSAAPAVNCCSFWVIYKSMVYIGLSTKRQLHVSAGLREAFSKIANDHIAWMQMHWSATHCI